MTESTSPQHGKGPFNDLPTLLRLPLTYWRQSIAVVVVVLAATGGYALFGVYQKSQIEKAENALGKIVLTKTGADRLTALDDLAKTAPATARIGVYLEMAKTAQDMGDFAKAVTAWETLSQNAPEGMKTVATLGYANALVKTGQADKAVPVLDALLASAPKGFTMTVDRQLAATAEAAGAWDKALAAYERMKAQGGVQNTAFIDARITALKAKADAKAKG